MAMLVSGRVDVEILDIGWYWKRYYMKHLDVWKLGVLLGHWMVLVFGRGYTSWILDYPLDPLDGMNAELFSVDFQKWYCHYLEPPVNEVIHVKCICLQVLRLM